MVATFLRAELDSQRYGPEIRALLDRDVSVITGPRLDDEEENAYRASLLDAYRAWLRRDGLFSGFPHDVSWKRVALTRDEVLAIEYINWDWWLRISGGTRRPLDAAARIRAGLVPGADVAGDEAIARDAANHPPLIAVSVPNRPKLVLVEGHVRLTAYALFPEYLPDELEILLGTSRSIERWSEF
jgi:hypothetical protein